jgi:glycosyltransferase involved in cell wall biosynthesis
MRFFFCLDTEMRILLLSAYDAVSHQYWRKGLVNALPEHDWTVLSLPARYFSWRIRGNSLSWAFGERERLQQPYDLVIATSMVDLTSLRGLVPSLAQTPCVVYFHENQFAYPASGHEHQSVEPLILNLYNALCADRVLFNSGYNRDTLLEGADRLLRKLPDQVPPGLVEQIRARSEVLHVPLPEQVFLPAAPVEGPLEIVWNHRWEFDKGPERLLAAVERLQSDRVDFRLHVVGQQFRRVPPVFEQLKRRLESGGQLGCWGHIESTEAYRQLLQLSDVVLSTALHDFQGIAVLEAVAAGCRPVVPDRLAYRELFAAEYRYAEQEETTALARMLAELSASKHRGEPIKAPEVEHLGWPALKASWGRVIETLTQGGAPSL